MADAPIIAGMTQATVAQVYLYAVGYSAQATGEAKAAADALVRWCRDVIEGIPPLGDLGVPEDEKDAIATILEGMHFDHPDLDAVRLHVIAYLRAETPPPPPSGTGAVFTMGPRPFGVAQTVAGIEWQTDLKTSGRVEVRLSSQPHDAPLFIVTDDSHQRDHQRTLSPLTSGTSYRATVAAMASNRPATVASVEFQTVGDVVTPPQDGGGSGLQSAIGCSNVATCNATEAEQILTTGLRLVQAEGIPFYAEKNGQGVSAWSLPRLVGIAKAVQRYPDAIFLLTVVNWNGASQRAQSTAWFDDRLNDIRREVFPLLGTRLWLEGVSEPDSGDAKCSDWIRRTAQSHLGMLVGNGPGGRGTPLAGGIVDWHYCDYGDLLRNLDADRLHSTDCTPTLASNLNEQQVREVTAAAIGKQARLMLYDTDNAHALNPNVLRWMADEVAKATPAAGGTISSPNLLESRYLPWKAGTLTQLDPGYEPALLAWCRANPTTTIILSDMDKIPDVMRYAGFEGRANALYFTGSRSYSEWNWTPNPGDPDNHLSDQRQELHDFWWNYMAVVLNVMKAVPAKRALYLLNDGHDKCGDVWSEYALRQLSPVENRIERGDVYSD